VQMNSEERGSSMHNGTTENKHTDVVQVYRVASCGILHHRPRQSLYTDGRAVTLPIFISD